MLTRILIVEDTPALAVLLRHTLEDMHYEVIDSVTTAEAALETARRLRPDLILMDIYLRDSEDGIFAATSIRRELDIPTIFMTSSPDEATVQRAKVAEPYGFLTKPIDPNALRALIEIAEYKHRAETRLKRLETLLTSTLNGLGNAVITTDINLCISYMNPEAERLTHCKWNDAHGRSYEDVLRCKLITSRDALDATIKTVLQNGSSVTSRESLTLLVSDEKEIEIDHFVAPLKNPNGEILGTVVSFQDVTEKRQAELKREAALKAQRDAYYVRATRDSLTGLANREMFCEKLQQAILEARRRSCSLGLLSLDMDNLKTVNDKIGHHAGDEALKEFALRLKIALRECDTAARFGGDEFAVILPEILEPDSIGIVTRRISEALKTPFVFEGYVLELAASIGSSTFPNDGPDAETLLRIADESMYEIKRRRKKFGSLSTAQIPVLNP